MKKGSGIDTNGGSMSGRFTVNFHAEYLYARLDIVGVTWVDIYLIPRSLWTDLLLPHLVHIGQGLGTMPFEGDALGSKREF